jgi:hypothetical protein
MTRIPSSSPAKRSYTQPFNRNPDRVPKRWRFEPRDGNILTGIAEHDRILTNCQVEALYFAPDHRTDNPRSAKRSAETRTQYLYHKGYIDRIQIQSLGKGRSTIANILAPAGIDYVTTRLGVDRKSINWKPKIVKNKPTSLNHSIFVNDVRITFERAIQKTSLKLKTWIPDGILKSKQMEGKTPFVMPSEGRSIKKVPDGAFALQYPTAEYGDRPIQPAGFFLEVDRGTESNAVWAEKVVAYEKFRESGLATRIFGVKNFRVLVTVSTERRLVNLMDTTSQSGGGPFYWFALQSEVDIFDPWRILDDIWYLVSWPGKYSLQTLTVKKKAA